MLDPLLVKLFGNLDGSCFPVDHKELASFVLVGSRTHISDVVIAWATLRVTKAAAA